MMLEIPFYHAITLSPTNVFGIFVVLLACFWVAFGILSAPYKTAKLTPWWVYLISPFLASLLTAIIVSVAAFACSKDYEAAFERADKIKQQAELAGMPARPAFTRYHKTIRAIADGQIPWPESGAAISQAIYGNEPHHYEGLDGLPSPNKAVLSLEHHRALGAAIDECVNWWGAPETFKTTLALYPVYTEDMTSLLEEIYQTPNIDWMDRECFSKFALPWVLGDTIS